MAKDKNASAAADFMKGLHEKAEKLRATRAWLAQREEEYQAATEAAFKEEANLKAELLDALKTLGLASVKVSSGESFFISKRQRFSFNSEIALTKWAEDNRLVRPDQELIKQKLKGLLGKPEFPAFAEVIESESISVRKAKEDKNVSE